MKNFTKAFAIAFLLLITANVSRGQTTSNFNDGYLIVFKVTSGSALTSTGTAIIMEEYVNTGSSQTSPNYYVALPSSPTTLGANDIVVAGTSTAVGEISRSENGRYILITGYNALIGAANTTFTTNSVVRTLNGTGIMGSGISGSNFLSGSNSLRGAVSEDLTNYWMSGSTVGITTSTNGTSVTIVSTTSTNTRACYIFNGQLYYTTGAGSQGIYSVGFGKPVVTGTTSTRLFTPANTDTYGFSISPDSLTIYYVASTSGGIYRSTYSGGVWSGGTLITSGFTGYGIAVDWAGYTFNLSGPNGAKIYACNPTTLISAPDNGTGTVTTTTLRTLTGNNAFRGLAFSPTKSTVGLGSFNPPAGNISSNTVNNKVFAFAYSADEGNVVMKKITVTNTGTANLNTDFSAFRLVFDADSNGTISPSERSASTTVTGTVSGSDIVFPGLTFSYVNQSSSGSYIIEADVTAAPISGNTLSLKIDKNNTINSNNYTTNLLNAGGSLVTMSGNAVSLTGNTQTINGLTPAITLSSLNPAVPAGSITQNTANNVIYSFNLAVITANATLSGLQITTAGSYIAADLTNLKAWYSADNTFDPVTDALLSAKATSLGAGLQVFPGWINQLINFGSTGYIFITTDIPCSATSGNTINVNAVTISDLTFISGNLYGSAFAGGTKTFQSVIPANVTVPSGTGGDAQVTLNWTNPAGCYNEIMITASSGTITTAPTGDGSAYTYNLHYGSGTPFGAGYVVYKGSATGQTVTGLSNGIPYYFKFFTRNGTSWSAGTEINVIPVTDPTLLSQSNFNSVIIPQIMSCGGTTRLPVVIRATLINLVPNKLYRYYSSGSAFADFGSTSVGAGNPMFINPDSANFRYTTSTSLTTAGGYDVFRANGSGTYTGWFSIVNTANARFTAGKYIIPSIAIGDSLGALVSRNALNDSIKVVNFSTNSADSCATGIYGISAAFPKNIVSVYDNTVGTGRPLSQTYLEDEGVTVASIVAFYSTNVNAQNGRWGSVIPNNNANGVRRIEQRDKITGSLMSFNTDADGLWQSGANTVNPSGGLTPVALQLIDAPLLDYAVLVSPANNAVNQSLSLTLDWNTVSYANSYRVQFAADSAFTTAILDSVLIADSIHIQGLSNGSVYWWRVAGITTTGTAPFGSAFSFTTIPSAPVAPVLFTPANNSTGNPLNLNLVWSKSQFATGYNVLMATDAGFTNIIFNDSLLTDSVKILTNLAPLTNYYWKVRAKNTGGWSNFSSVFTFKTIGVPTTVTLYSPSNNAVNQPINLTFKWFKAVDQVFNLFDGNSGKDADNDDPKAVTNYRFELATDSLFTAVVTIDSTLTDTVKSVTSLLNLNNYYWRVQAKNQIGWAAYSSIWKFTTIVSIPAAPVLVFPANNSTGVTLIPAISWTAVPGAVSYRLQVSTDSLFATTQIDTAGVTGTGLSVPANRLTGLTKYYWRVNAANAAGTGPYSAVWNFRTLQSLTLNLKVYLEGFWNGTTQVSDTTMVYLANSTTPFAFVDSAKAVLSGSGEIMINFSKAPNANYYIVVNHRNHLETWSKLPQAFVTNVAVAYDFTTAANKAFGDNMKQAGTVWVLYGGDANSDGAVDALDIALFIVQFGNSGYLSCDFNGDGSVDALDVPIIVANFGLGKSVPVLDVQLPGNIRKEKVIEEIQKKYKLNGESEKKETFKKTLF